ncbi:MAG TPA: chemotaxis protein CheD [Candidatus Hydrogenedentes bacterium]|nr:chemotaxis protein CheD [Candidatus Hydrogenedentota bacterium]HPG67203.1 chemotaxis protein CheD [Candidatus Hydrogenedentota bacterium]
MQYVIGIGEMKTSTNPDDVLVTYSLGSCVGLSLYDPTRGIGGLIHCMLPLSKIDPDKARGNPERFTDTGVLCLLQALLDLGAERSRLIAKVAGAASLLDEKGLFRIGERNHTVLRKVLWKNNILIDGEDVGGTAARTMYLYMNSGTTIIRSAGQETKL